MVLDHQLTELRPPVCGLHAENHFLKLTKSEQLYAHYMSRAAFSGNRIILRQISPEAENIFDLIIKLYHACNGDIEGRFRDLGLNENEIDSFLVYAAMVLDNMGNYKSFGDSKFLPRLNPQKFSKVASITEETAELYDRVSQAIFSPEPSYLGHPEKGMLSMYYPDSPGITSDEVSKVHQVLVEKTIGLENTRLKRITGLHGSHWELLVASAQRSPISPSQSDTIDLSVCGEGFEGSELKIIYGDHAADLQRVVDNLYRAKRYAANDHQRQMLAHYIESFETGSISAHLASQISWIRDISPGVETNLGFIESYRDPHSVHAEWDGLVAIVNKEQSQKYAKLVESSSELIAKLPWNVCTSEDKSNPRKGPFERASFERPDFTSLEILSYSTSQIWAGINIPNYDDIRQSIGFKNVTLANRLAAQAPRERIPFIPPEEVDQYRRRRPLTFQIAVAIHELIGHGSGLLLSETSPGTFNFDREQPPINPLTHKPVQSWYQIGQTYNSVFGSLARACEECRAECVATFLASETSILRLFGCSDEPGDTGFDEILYTTYLQMAYMGVFALQTYDPKMKKWGQAHERARFAILNQLLKRSSLLELVHSDPTYSDLTIRIDRSKILSEGQKAIGDLLLQIQIFRATADVENASNIFEELTTVDDRWLQVREVVWKNRQPRKLFVQPNTFVRGDDDEVTFRDYELTTRGIIQSWAERDI